VSSVAAIIQWWNTEPRADHPKHRGIFRPFSLAPIVQLFDMRTLTSIVVACFLAVNLGAVDKRDWQEGKTLSSERREEACPKTPCVYQEFQIAGEKKIYTARETIRFRWSKEANLTVNGPVRFAVDAHERKLFVIDEDGKEHGMEIVSKALRN
jgi:hypothetical protein